MTYLDTHIVIWLYDALLEKFSSKVRSHINTEDQLVISPLVRLELQYLYEVGKVTVKPDAYLTSLAESIGLEIGRSDYQMLVNAAISFDWTRDVFDRLIVADAHIHNAYLISADKKIRDNYPLTVK